MLPRDVRMVKRNKAVMPLEIIDDSSKKVAKSSAKAMPPEIIDDSSAKAMPPEIMDDSGHGHEIPSIIIREDGNPDRQIVILPYERSDLWQIPNIAYFRSSGTSNKGCGWLCGTFFPTGGITTKAKISGKSTFDEECRGTGGHLLKMSDITNDTSVQGIIKSIYSFYTDLATEIDRFFVQELPRKLYITPTIFELFDAFNTYFLSEHQLLLSYRLSFTEDLHDHIGLWGWECTDSKNKTYKLSDFCNKRWSNPTPINVPNRDINIMSSEGACNFIKQNNASVEFNEIHERIAEDNLVNGKKFSNSIALSMVIRLNSMYSTPHAKATAKGIQKKKITNKKKRKGYKRFKTIRKYGKIM